MSVPRIAAGVLGAGTVDRLTTDQHDSRSLPIAVDAMGGDLAPAAVVEGGIDAVRAHGLSVVLVGEANAIQPLITSAGGDIGRLSVIDAPEIVAMDEHAVAAVRRKSRASIPIALDEVRQGRARAMVSAGNSGAVVAAAIFALGRAPGVERPGIAIPFPTLSGAPVYLVDAGAVVDPRPNHLVGYALLIRDYLKRAGHPAEPRIGLLSNGEEPGKGSSLVRAAHELLAAREDINFVGNVEANQLPTGHVDAVVCDGFSGNIALKTAEGTAALMQETLRRELTRTWPRRLLAAALRPAFRQVGRRLDYREYGGAPLLGVRGTVIIAHGRSDARAIANSILAAHRASIQHDGGEMDVSQREPGA